MYQMPLVSVLNTGTRGQALINQIFVRSILMRDGIKRKYGTA